MPSIGQKADNCVNPRTDPVRSAPIYIDTPNGTITLIKEGPAPTPPTTTVHPTAVYIIDDKGVRRISLARSNKKRLLPLLLLLLLAFALRALLRKP